jgi:hypothetical protein
MKRRWSLSYIVKEQDYPQMKMYLKLNDLRQMIMDVSRDKVCAQLETNVEKVDIGKKSTRVRKTSFRKKSANNRKITTNIKKYKIYSFFQNFKHIKQQHQINILAHKYIYIYIYESRY